MSNIHFIRPEWFLAILPLLLLGAFLWRTKPQLGAWQAVCDAHLLPYLQQKKDTHQSLFVWWPVLLSMIFMILSLTGPSWEKMPAATYKPIQPRVIILDMSNDMLAKDLPPNRLARAKFKLHDLLMRKDIGQLGLLVFTSEPFVVSPLNG